MQELFHTGQASPFDRRSDGWTVLDVGIPRDLKYTSANNLQRAAFWEQVEVCRFLMTQGADPNVSYER